MQQFAAVFFPSLAFVVVVAAHAHEHCRRVEESRKVERKPTMWGDGDGRQPRSSEEAAMAAEAIRFEKRTTRKKAAAAAARDCTFHESVDCQC